MPGREISLVNDEYYHVYNRGVAKLPIFFDDNDYSQALLDINYYRFLNTPIKLSKIKRLKLKNRLIILDRMEQTSKKIVDLICFVFMPNHWHMLLRQNEDGGISKFISQFSNSYTKYFNTKHNRVGSIFQGVFKAVHVELGEQLLHLSRYIHINPVISGLVNKDKILQYKWSSYSDFVSGNSRLCQLKPILENFRSFQEYENFVNSQIDYAENLELIKHATLDLDR